MLPRHTNARPSWPSSDDTMAFNLIVIAIGVCVGGYLLWTNFHATIAAMVMQVMHAEIEVLGHFTHRFALADRQMAASDPAGVTLRDLYGILHDVGLYVRWLAAGFIGILAVLCFLGAAPSRFRRAFDLEGLLREQVNHFPAARAFLRHRLALSRLPDGAPRPADYALTGEEWVDRFGSSRDGGFNEARVTAALTQQLGPRWQGAKAAAPVVRVLFVAFALHMAERREDAIGLLGAVSTALSASDGKAKTGPEAYLTLPPALVAEADALLEDERWFADAAAAAGQHAYTTPALMTVLNTARLRAGVFAPAQFAWLKLVDRSLWYALHSLGFESEGIGRYLHPSPRAEAAGARDHWAAERAAGRPVTWPCMERALSTLRQARAARKARTPTS